MPEPKEPICPACGRAMEYGNRGKVVCKGCGFFESCCEGPLPCLTLPEEKK